MQCERWILWLGSIIVLLTLTSCAKKDLNQLLLECNELKNQNTLEAWQKIRQKLEIVIKQAKLDESRPGVENIYNFYVMSLIRTSTAEDLPKIETIARDVLTRYPENFLSNFNLGKVYMLQNNPRSAYPYLEKAVKLNPSHTQAYTLLLIAAEECAEPSAGLYFEKASKMDPFRKDAKFFNLWGMWCVSQGLYSIAINRFSEARNLDDKALAPILNIAVIYDQHLKMPRVAQKYYLMYRELLAMNPETNTRQNHLPVQNRLREIFVNRP